MSGILLGAVGSEGMRQTAPASESPETAEGDRLVHKPTGRHSVVKNCRKCTKKLWHSEKESSLEYNTKSWRTVGSNRGLEVQCQLGPEHDAHLGANNIYFLRCSSHVYTGKRWTVWLKLVLTFCLFN